MTSLGPGNRMPGRRLALATGSLKVQSDLLLLLIRERFIRGSLICQLGTRLRCLSAFHRERLQTDIENRAIIYAESTRIETAGGCVVD